MVLGKGCEEVRNVESVMCHVIRLVVEVVERERRFEEIEYGVLWI